MWMDPETVIDSEVSQKEKKKLYINVYMCNLEKNGRDEPIYKAEIET